MRINNLRIIEEMDRENNNFCQSGLSIIVKKLTHKIIEEILKVYTEDNVH